MNGLNLVELSSNLRCTYCHDEIGYVESTWECPRCATSQHVECAGELGRCAVFGCEASVPRRDPWRGWHFAGRPGPSETLQWLVIPIVVTVAACISMGLPYAVLVLPMFKMTQSCGD